MNALDPASGGGGEERTEDKPSVAASSSAMEPTKQRSKKDWRIGYFSNAKARLKRKSHSVDTMLGLKATMPSNKSAPDLRAQEEEEEEEAAAEGSGDPGGVNSAGAPRLPDGAAHEPSPSGEQEVPASPVDGIELKSPEKKGRKVSFQKPQGTVEYTVEEKDTLNSIALRFNTTPNELLHTNRLFSHTIVTGQCLYVPDPDHVGSERHSPTTSPCSPSAQHPLDRGQAVAAGSRERPLASSSPQSHRVLRDQASLSEEEEPMTKKFLKISCKYITNGKGVVGGVLLVTPNSLMFDPHKSDPLVLEHGCRAYGLLCPMEEVVSAAVYRDTAHMSIRDTLPANFSECFCPASRPEDVGAFAPEHELSPFTRLERERAHSAVAAAASRPTPEAVPDRSPEAGRAARPPPSDATDGRACRPCDGTAGDDGDRASDDACGSLRGADGDGGDDADDDETPSDRASWSLASAVTRADGSSSACENGDGGADAEKEDEEAAATWAEETPGGARRERLESTTIQGDASPLPPEARRAGGVSASPAAADLSSVDAATKSDDGGTPDGTAGPGLPAPDGGESERPGGERGAAQSATPSGEEDAAKGEESSGISVEEHAGRDLSNARAEGGAVAAGDASAGRVGEPRVAEARDGEVSTAPVATSASAPTPSGAGAEAAAETSLAEETDNSGAGADARSEQSSGISMGSSPAGGRSTVWYVDEEELPEAAAGGVGRAGDRDDKEEAAAAADVSSEGQDEHPGPDVARPPHGREPERSARKWRGLADLPRRVVAKGPAKEAAGSAQQQQQHDGAQKGAANARQKRGGSARQKRGGGAALQKAGGGSVQKAGAGGAAQKAGGGGVQQRKGVGARQEEGVGARREDGGGARREEGPGVPQSEGAGTPSDETAGVQREGSDEVQREEGGGGGGSGVATEDGAEARQREDGGGGVKREDGDGERQEGTARDARADAWDGAAATKLAGSGKKKKGDGGDGVPRTRLERTKSSTEAQKEPLHRLLKTMEEPIEALLPAREPESDSPPMFLCLRVGKPMRCSFEPARSPVVQHYACRGAQPEYWFAVPKDRVDQLYTFFAQWTPEVCGCGGGGGGGSGASGASGDGSGELGFVVLERHDAEALEAIEDFYSDSSMDWEIVTVEEALRRHSLHTLTDSEPEPMWPTLNVESNFLQHHHIEKLVPELPPRTVGYTWSLLYGTAQHGTSLSTLYRSAALSDSPALLVVCDTDGQVFGAFVSAALRCNDHYYGTGETFLFTFNPEFKIFKWTGENSFFISGDKDCLVIGGGDGVFGLWLGSDLYHGSSRRCHTFDNDPLAARDDFCVRALEVWAFE